MDEDTEGERGDDASSLAVIGTTGSATNDSTGRPRTSLDDERNHQRQLLLLALIDQFCASYEQDPERSRRLYLQVCKQLVRSGLVDSANVISDSHTLQYTASQLFVRLVGQAIHEVDNERAAKRLPSTGLPEPLATVVRPRPRASLLMRTVSEGASSSDASLGKLSSSSPSSFASLGRAPGSPCDLSYRYLREFDEGPLLGRGGFGQVVEATNKLDGRAYAVKKVPMKPSAEKSYPKILREVRLFALLDHPSIVRYYSAWIEVQEQPASLRSSAASQTPPDDKANRVARIRSLSEAADELEDGSDEAWSPMFAAQISAEGLSSQSIDDDDDDDDVEEEDEEEKEEDDDDNDNDGSGDDHHGDEATMPKTREPRSQKAPASPNTHLLRMTLYIQMELCRETLLAWLQQRNERVLAAPAPPSSARRLSDADLAEAWRIFRHIVLGVQYLHSQNLIHRDIKPQNIFFQEGGSDRLPKIGDFGLSNKPGIAAEVVAVDLAPSVAPTRSKSRSGGTEPAGDEFTSGLGTLSYGAPEQLRSGHYTEAVDLYPLGIILFELLHPMATGMERANAFRDLRNGLLPPSFVSAWPAEASLVIALTSTDPTERPSAAELLDLDLLRFHGSPPPAPPLLRSPSGSTSSISSLGVHLAGLGLASESPSTATPDLEATFSAALDAKDREIDQLRKQLQDQQLMLKLLQSE